MTISPIRDGTGRVTGASKIARDISDRKRIECLLIQSEKLGVSVDLRFNDLQKIVVSKGEMLQVFSNVIANAIDAMYHGGSLNISTRNLTGPAGDGIQTILRDSGTGIKREHMERIFEPFFITKGELGTGIGLWVARQLIEKRGGQISVASGTEQENSGTTITILLPFASPISRLSTDQK